MCLAALLCEQFYRFANGGDKIAINSYFMEIIFFFSVYSAAAKCQANMLPFGVNCRLQLAGLGRKERKLSSHCFVS